MATEVTRVPDEAVKRAFEAGAVSRNGAISVHMPLDHVDVGAGTITAAVTPPSMGDVGLSHATLRELYSFVALARALDERMWQLNRAGRAPFVVSGQGHEAAQVGAAFALDRSKDVVLPYYRDLALSLVFGLTARDVMMSALARAADPASGARQMPAHYGSAKLRIITSSSPVSTQIPHATGVAYAAKLRGTGQVSLTCFGEGGASKGDFHEACNFAGVHKLPVIFFCENNRYAISVPLERQMAIDNVADRAAGYGFPGVIVDGTDLLAVYQVVKAAADRARRGDGPTLVEAKVYRFHPHTSDDDDRAYRSPDEVKAWRARDPLALFEARLREVGALDDESLAEIRTRITGEVDAATEAAEQAPFPDPVTFDRHVYAER
ncbi:MAG TPA: thiamine pyrophosphate-dependent dehydrogenase E1 component subunit alpha [Thermomicrobiales bacterium]|nr:thiamine pyrophosphate-dependent dehydrogenase E1 component subunit alpha [Thermomicrobiales bacterium]